MPAPNPDGGLTVADPSLVHWGEGVLEAIRDQAWEGFTAFGHGGLEVGGVLFGRRTEQGLRVELAVPVECDHSRGPGFVLSAADQAKLDALLVSPPRAANGLEAAGWYRSFTRTGIGVSERDSAIHHRFAAPWQVFLGLKPARLGPASAALFRRSGSGPELDQRTDFEIGRAWPGGSATATVEDVRPPAPVLAERAAPGSVEPPAMPAAPVAVATPAPARPGGFRLSQAVWVPAAFLLAIALGAGMAWVRGPEPKPAPAPVPVPPLQLRAVREQDNLRVEWDRAVAAAGKASEASLEVTDGGARNRFDLEAATLRAGSVVYHPQSGDVTIRMQVRGPAGETLAEETVRHLLPRAAPAIPVEARAEPAAAPVEPPPSRSGDRRDRTALAGPPSQVTPLIRTTRPFVAARTGPAGPAEALPSPPGTQPTTPLTPPQLQFRVPAAAPAYRGPRAGRLIWTGYLERRGVVEVDHGKASVGALTGSLPGVPVDVHVFPAELGDKGLVVFSDDGKLNAMPRMENPAAANGWNRTIFTYEPARAHSIAVIETPNSANAYQRLVLRSDGRNSVVVVEWNVR